MSTTCPPARVRNDKRTRKRALQALGIDRPVYVFRLVGRRLEIRCYGGAVYYWPPDAQPKEE